MHGQGIRKKRFILRKKILLTVAVALLLATTVRFMTLLPGQLFKTPYSTVIEDEEGALLSAIIADDGQWRFPANPEVPARFVACITEFEDASFFLHHGVDMSALVKAAVRNIREGRIVSGGSTITMQVIRLSRMGKPRTFKEKITEMFMALRLEMSYSKGEILAMYVAHAPFGGNVVGLEAAAWRYFGIEPEQLSWGQSATLAVLPNAPSLIYPGKNDTLLLNKRNRLLKKLFEKNYFGWDVYELAITEPLPGKPYPLPSEGVHILNRVLSDNMKGQRVSTTIRKDVQQFVQSMVNKHAFILSGNKVYNAAALVIEVESGNIIAYVGNSTDSREHNNLVDMINAERSPGSTLKPFLYCAMLNDGILLPRSLVPDVPMILQGFNPQNYYRTYEGAVHADGALARSLNVPAVYMLRQYGIEKFSFFLKKAGFTTFRQPAHYYGLSIILGGAEVKLCELAGAYASMARILLRYNESGTYDPSDVFQPRYTSSVNEPANDVIADAASIWLTFKAMIEVNRPDEDQFWYHFSSKAAVAWKTGTSYGERDAWAVGVTPKYVVGVWAGNSSGEGRPGLTGLQAAAPLMFEIFSYLPSGGWFKEPVNEMTDIKVCTKSGFKASEFCETTTVMRVPSRGIRTPVCPYHKQIHLDSSRRWQVNADCEPAGRIITENRFVLPPVMEYYYRMKNPYYKSLPSFRDDCTGIEGESDFSIIYPVNGSRIYLIGGEDSGEVVFRAAHRKPDAVLYWHIDGDFAGTTTGVHTIALTPGAGKHQLTVADQSGEVKICFFEILNKR